METSSTAITDNQAWSPTAEAELNAPQEKSRTKRRPRKSGRQRLAEMAPRRPEREQRVELPFTIWDRTNPDVLRDPNAKPLEKVAEQTAVAEPEHPVKPKQTEAKPLKTKQKPKAGAPPEQPSTPAETESTEETSPKNDTKEMNQQKQATMPESAASLSAIEQARQAAEESYATWTAPEMPPLPSEAAKEAAAEPAPAAKKLEKSAKRPVLEAKPAEISEAQSKVTEAAKEQPSAASIGEQLSQVAKQTAARAAEFSARHKPEEAENKKETGVKAETTTESQAKHESKSEPEAPHYTAEHQSATEAQATSEHDTGMSREDMLALAASIRLEGVSIEEMYKAKRIDEEGLRRIVVAFLRGEDVHKLVASEVIRYQMRFERDPQLRATSVTAAPQAPEVKPRRTKQVAVRAKTHAKTALDPKRMKHGANRLADRLIDGVDRTREYASTHPATAKNAAIATAVVVYFIILIAIIRA